MVVVAAGAVFGALVLAVVITVPGVHWQKNNKQSITRLAAIRSDKALPIRCGGSGGGGVALALTGRRPDELLRGPATSKGLNVSMRRH